LNAVPLGREAAAKPWPLGALTDVALHSLYLVGETAAQDYDRAIMFISRHYLSKQTLKAVLLIYGILVSVILFFCGIVFVLPTFRPTAVQQLLRLTDLPQDLKLLPEHPGPWGSHDFTQVEQALLQQVPMGSTEATIQAFLVSHQTSCETEQMIIRCAFYHDSYPCRTTVYLQWFLNASRQLDHIRIMDNETCL